MMLQDDLTDLIRQGVARSLLPGATMPEEGEGLYGRVDPLKMDRELELLRYKLRSYVPDMNAPFGPGRGLPAMDSLQLLAAFWKRAENARRAVATTADNPTIRTISESIRRATYIRSHERGHEARFPAKSRREAMRRLLKVAVVPTLAFPVFAAIIFSSSACEGCRAVRWEKVMLAASWGAALSLMMLVMIVLPGFVAMVRHRGV